MSDNSSTEVVMSPETEAKIQPVTEINKGNGVVLKRNQINTWQGVKYKNGFKYWAVSFLNLAAALSHLGAASKTGKTGEDIVLALLNDSMEAKARSRASNRLMVPDKVDGKETTPEWKTNFIKERQSWIGDEVKEVLFSPDEAYSFVPGERETNSLAGLLRLKTELGKNAKKLYSAGDKAGAKELAVKYQETCRQIEELQAAEETAIQEMMAMLEDGSESQD